MSEGAVSIVLGNGPAFESVRQLRMQIDLWKFLALITPTVSQQL